MIQRRTGLKKKFSNPNFRKIYPGPGFMCYDRTFKQTSGQRLLFYIYRDAKD